MAYAFAVSSKPAFLLLPALLLATLTACSSSSGLSQCTGTTTSIEITVADDSNETSNICDATVTLTGGGVSQTLTLRSGAECSYVGSVTKPGPYMITTDAPSYPAATNTIDVQVGCSVSLTVEVTMQ